MKQALEVVGFCRPRGEYTLVGAVELIRSAVEQSRDRGVSKLLINGHEMSGVPIPSLIDRFLMVEEWAHEAQGMVPWRSSFTRNTFTRRNLASLQPRTSV